MSLRLGVTPYAGTLGVWTPLLVVDLFYKNSKPCISFQLTSSVVGKIGSMKMTLLFSKNPSPKYASLSDL